MRGGTYGWQAADAGYLRHVLDEYPRQRACLGSAVPVIGNNPLIIAIPASARGMSFWIWRCRSSPRGLDAYSRRGAPLPVPGGYDTEGNLTTDSAAIEASQRALPIGYWKGSGLSLVLDMLGAMLSGGLATHQLPLDPLHEAGLSQFFLAIDPANLASAAELAHIADGVIANLHSSPPIDTAQPLRYPGEQTLRLREENLRLGVPVDPEIWQQINLNNL